MKKVMAVAFGVCLALTCSRVDATSPAAISVVSGNHQFGSAIEGSSVPTQPLRVRVVDESGVAVSSVAVTFTFSSPRGDVFVAGGPIFQASTDSQGVASLASFLIVAGEGFFNVFANTSPPLPVPAVFLLSHHASVGCGLPALRPLTMTSMSLTPNPAQDGTEVLARVIARTQSSAANVTAGEVVITDADRIMASKGLSPAAPSETAFTLDLPRGPHLIVARLQETCFYRASVSSPTVLMVTSGLVPALDYTDMWWKATESGWGMSVIQHASGQLFVVWYHYREDGSPQWLVIPGGVWTSATSFTGAMYRTSGPAYNGLFDPSRVSVVPVGVGTLSFTEASRGTFTWWVDGANGVKSIERQSF